MSLSELGKKLPSKQKQSSYTQKYRKEWESDPRIKDWISRVPGDDSVCKCKYCGCVIRAHYKGLIDHADTKKHIKAAPPFSTERQPQSTLMFKPAPRRLNETSVAEAGMALFVTCHCALRNVDHLTKLNKCVFETAQGSKDIQLNRSKCTAIIKNVLAPHFKSELKADIGDGPYSVLIDESTDIGVTKQLGLCIIYLSMSTGKDVSTFLDLYQLEKADAAHIAEGVKTVLGSFGLELLKMRGIGTDNASVMTGVNTGVYQRLKAEIPYLVLIRCVCHSIQLAVSAAVKLLPQHLEFLIAETYSWFSRSAGRQAHYEALYKAINNGIDPLKILQMADTRWLSICPAVKRILAQWTELHLHFQILAGSDRSYKAGLLSNMYSDIRNELYLIFLEPILEDCNKVNKIFQLNENDPVKLLSSLTLLIKGLAERVVVNGCEEDLLKVDIKNHLKQNPDLGHNFEKKMAAVRSTEKPALSANDDAAIRSRCVDFVVALVDQLQKRLPDNVHVLESVCQLSPEKCLRRVKPSIVPLAQLMQEPSDVITKIDYQWSKLSFVEWSNTEKTVPFWLEVHAYKDAAGENPFQDLVSLALKCVVLPWSNGEIERAFSMMNLVKTPLRNKLKDKTLVAILIIRAGLRRTGKCCESYKFPRSVYDQIGTKAAYQPPAGNAAAENDTPSVEQELTDADCEEIDDCVTG